MNTEDTQVLLSLGLTRIQSEIYRTLIRTGKADAKTICNNCNVPREEIYRVLKELQKKGLIESIIASPTKFEAIPKQEAMSILIKRKYDDYKKVERKVKKSIHKSKACDERKPIMEYQLRNISGKEALINKFLTMYDNTSYAIEGIYYWKDFVNIITDRNKKMEKDLNKGLQARFIVYTPMKIKKVVKIIQTLETKGSFDIRYTLNTPHIILTIFDKKEILLCLDPQDNAFEVPGLWSNNPHFVKVLCEYFEKEWCNLSKTVQFEVEPNVTLT